MITRKGPATTMDAAYRISFWGVMVIGLVMMVVGAIDGNTAGSLMGAVDVAITFWVLTMPAPKQAS